MFSFKSSPVVFPEKKMISLIKNYKLETTKEIDTQKTLTIMSLDLDNLVNSQQMKLLSTSPPGKMKRKLPYSSSEK
jgi:hypothetical protein